MGYTRRRWIEIQTEHQSGGIGAKLALLDGGSRRLQLSSICADFDIIGLWLLLPPDEDGTTAMNVFYTTTLTSTADYFHSSSFPVRVTASTGRGKS
jgi:hypothetical protein